MEQKCSLKGSSRNNERKNAARPTSINDAPLSTVMEKPLSLIRGIFFLSFFSKYKRISVEDRFHIVRPQNERALQILTCDDEKHRLFEPAVNAIIIKDANMRIIYFRENVIKVPVIPSRRETPSVAFSRVSNVDGIAREG